MAQVRYDPVPSAAPEATPPSDYLRVQADPSETGGLIAQGLDKFGAGAINAQKYFGQIQTDDASNNYQKEASGLVEHVRTLQGADALNAQDGFNKSLVDLYAKYKGQLNSPAQEIQFDNQNRAFTDRYILGQANTHFVEQGQQFGMKTTDDAINVAHNMAATAGSLGNEKDMVVARAKALDAEKKKLMLTGQENDPDAQAAAVQRGNLVYKSYAEGLAASGPGGAMKAKQFLDRPEIKGALGANYDPLYNAITTRADKQIGENANAQGSAAVSGGWVPNGAQSTPVAGQRSPGGGPWAKAADGSLVATDRQGQAIPQVTPATLQGKPPPTGDYGPRFTQYNRFLNGGDVQSALRLSEGLRTNAYWDVNHWRTGYGSDTVTRADGSVEPVTATTTITPADAERDLQRRTALASQTASSQIGGQAWGALSPGAQAALTSVVYNYGHLPADIAAAGASGDKAALANAIAAHAHDNDGVNANRRRAEAGAVLGGFGVGGAAPMANAPTMAMPSSAQPGVAPPEPAGAPETPQPPEGVEPASFTPQPLASAAAPGPASDPDEFLARKIQWIEGRGDISDQQKEYAVAAAQRDYKVAQLAAEQDARAKKDQKEAVLNEYDGYILKGDYSGAYARMATDNRLDNTEKLTLQDLIERRSGQPNPTAYGPRYGDMFKRVLAPSDDPNRIGDAMAIYRAEANGEITAKGSERLKSVMMDVRKGTDEYGLQRQVDGVYDYAKQRLDYAVNKPFLKVKDPEGQAVYDLKFLTMFNGQLDSWRREGKDVSQFPLFERKKLDQMLDTLRPKAQMDAEYMAAMGEAPAQVPEPANAPLPPAPAGVDQQGWLKTIGAPPPGFTHAAWGAALNLLATDPKNAAAFDASKFGRAGYRAAEILAALHPPPAAPSALAPLDQLPQSAVPGM